MAKIILDMALDAAISGAPCDPEAAAEVLRLAAPYLRDLDTRGELPLGLGKYLADAFEVAMAKPVKNRTTQLSRELHLKAENRRPKNHWDIGDLMATVIETNQISKNAAAKIVSQSESISESTAKKAHTAYLAMLEYHPQWQAEEDRLELEENERIQQQLDNDAYEDRLADAARMLDGLTTAGQAYGVAIHTAAREHGTTPTDIETYIRNHRLLI